MSNEQEQVNKCSICLENIINNIQTELCGHIFHISCIEQWLNSRNDEEHKQNTCPECRMVIREYSSSEEEIESYSTDIELSEEDETEEQKEQRLKRNETSLL